MTGKDQPPYPTGREAYSMVRGELMDPKTDLSDLDEKVVEVARTYARRSHKRWPPRYADRIGGWRYWTWYP